MKVYIEMVKGGIDILKIFKVFLLEALKIKYFYLENRE